jgi:hypothetical protein
MLLYRHNHHLGNLGSKSFEKKSKKFRCHICPRHYDRQFSLQRHLALHKGDKSYKCDECHARFSLPFNLSRHRKKVHFVGKIALFFYDCCKNATLLSFVKFFMIFSFHVQILLVLTLDVLPVACGSSWGPCSSFTSLVTSPSGKYITLPLKMR